MPNRIVIHQPNFLPYLGFFEQVAMAGIYVAFDDVQFQENEYQNRNSIKGPTGKVNLTLSVKKRGRFGQSIKDVEVADEKAIVRIQNKLEECYRGAPFRKEVIDVLFGSIDTNATKMIDVNLPFLLAIFRGLGVRVDVVRSSSIGVQYKDKTDRLIRIMKAVGADELVVGTGAAEYLNRGAFIEAGCDYTVHKFKPTEYPQMHGQFISHLSIVDYLMNAGWKPWR